MKVARTLTAVPTLVPWSNAMRAQRWLDAKALATPSMMTIALAGVSFCSMRAAIIGCLFAAPALACDYPDLGNLPLRRAVTRVEMLPEVHAWARDRIENGVKPQYAVRLDQPVRERGKCYWPVEIRAEGKLWRRYLVTPDGKNIRLSKPH